MKRHGADGPSLVVGPDELQLAAQSGRFDEEPVIFMLQPQTMQVRDSFGRVETADLLEEMVRAAGGQPLIPLPDQAQRSAFVRPCTPGWNARLRVASEFLVVRFPDDGSLYEGTMPTDDAWRRDVEAAGDVVVITGPMADLRSINPAIESSLTTYVRVKVSLRR
ncbi:MULTISPECIES: hypothetical protein [Streptomyces]|uniref:hypothetical protein n=1 Tax=Streptomyces TaxID=1883 RepID=UPI001181388A|nr:MULTISPECIES: hypothetical protein [Streptomyces]MCX4506646.1 hypothetical protein [Streptomyces anulatus]